MTVSTTTIKNSYSGNGSATAFNYTFKIFASAELKVYIRTEADGTETLKTVTTHYTVSGIGDTGGGTVTFTAGNVPTSAQQVLLTRDSPLTQSTDYVENDPFPASSHEDALDKLTHQMQEQQEELDRSFKVSKTVTDLTSSEVVDDAATRASKLLGFSANGASFAYFSNPATDVELTSIASLTSAANKMIRYTGSGTADLIDFLDQDDMSGNSASAVPSQQSVVAYVAAQITAEDLDVTSDSGTIAIDLNSETLTVAGGTGLASAATSNTVTLNIDSTVATLAGTQTLTNKTLNSPKINDTTAITSTGAELNILDGVTSTAAELNILDGVTSTAAELNILDGVTSTAAELNILDGATVVVGEINALDIGATAIGTAVASKAIILDANKDYTGVRNFTISGELDAATLDISGAIDVAGNSVLASVDVTGLATAATFEPDGDTSAGDNAAMGYTSVLGAILTGQGSTNDVTLVNDADATVLGIPTGTTNVTMAGALAVTGGITGVTGLNSGQIGGRRNILYNGAMNVAQRSASVAGVGAASGYHTVDRWRLPSDTAGRLTMAQIADGPAGFANCTKLSCTTADTSIAAGEIVIIAQNIEGQDLQQIKKGTASAEQLTLSFWVKGNASATYVAELYDNNNARQISKTFAVTTSWAKITLTYPADTTGAFTDNNAHSLGLNIWLHAGATWTGGTLNSSAWAANNNANRAVGISSIVDATSRTFFITGVQMEIGATATEFESRTYGEELALCQRYYEKSYAQSVVPGTASSGPTDGGVFYAVDTASAIGNTIFKAEKRATPSIVTYDNTGASGRARNNMSGASFVVSPNDITTTAFNRITGSYTATHQFSAQWTATAEL